MLRALRWALANPAFADLRESFRARPPLLSPFGKTMLRQCVLSVRDFDLAWRLLTWVAWRRARPAGRPARFGRVYRAPFRAAWKAMYAMTPQSWLEDSFSRDLPDDTEDCGR